ncbi:dolichyl-phosphate beta-glucosyltransferase [Paenarthrobacter aurescens]|uniref:dolichyl-phosphate beta-glucosyltransferase n=1 Tax=Paenarthrobacter aurescens TaxID=43663 RepID=UPI0005C14B32
MTLTDPTTSALARRTHSARLRGAALPTGHPALLQGQTGPSPQPRRLPVDTSVVVPVLDLTVPVYNEEARLEHNLRQLHGHLTRSFPHTFRITVADNASTDSTLRIAERLARELPELTVVRFQERGRGNALRQVWQSSPSPVLAYMEADLSTDLSALAPLVAPLISGHSDLAIGTRLAPGSRVTRSPHREFISRSYTSLLRTVLGARFSDAQCGFKAVRADVAHRLLPHTTDDSWFFDTELLVIAERCGLRVHEVPVDWTDDADSRVDVVRTALADLRGMARLNRNLRRIPIHELRRELGVKATLRGSLSRRVFRALTWTLAYAVVFLLIRNATDPWMASVVALLLTTWVTRPFRRYVMRGSNF